VRKVAYNPGDSLMKVKAEPLADFTKTREILLIWRSDYADSANNKDAEKPGGQHDKKQPSVVAKSNQAKKVNKKKLKVKKTKANKKHKKKKHKKDKKVRH
jgi:hypothetical protein